MSHGRVTGWMAGLFSQPSDSFVTSASSDHAGKVSQLESGACNSVEICHYAQDHSVCMAQTGPKQGSKFIDFQGSSRTVPVVPLWYRQF